MVNLTRGTIVLRLVRVVQVEKALSRLDQVVRIGQPSAILRSCTTH